MYEITIFFLTTSMQNQNQEFRNRWAVIAGFGGKGANQVVEKILDRLRSQGLQVAGAYHEAVRNEEGLLGYDLINIGMNERTPLARKTKTLELQEFCDLHFCQEAFTKANEWFDVPDVDVVALSLGPLEARKDGHWQTVISLLSGTPKLVLLLIRPDVLASIMFRLPDPIAGLSLPTQSSELDGFIETIYFEACGKGKE